MRPRTQNFLIAAGALLALILLALFAFQPSGSEQGTEALDPDLATDVTPSNGRPTPLIGNDPQRVAAEEVTTTPLETAPRANQTLVVRVVDRYGNVLENASVGLTNEQGENSFSMRGAATNHVFDELTPGLWKLHAYAEGFMTLEEDVELSAKDIEHEHTVRLLRSALVTVRFLTPDGQDATEALELNTDPPITGEKLFAVATPEEPGEFVPRMAPGARLQYGLARYHPAVTLKHGRSEIPYPGDEYAGVLEMKVDEPVYVSAILREIVLDTQRVEGSRDIAFIVSKETIEKKLASLTVRFVDAENGEPMEGLTVTLDDAHIAGIAKRSLVNGTATFERHLPGWAFLRAWGSDYEIFQTSVLLEAGANQDLGTLRISKSVPATGRVVNEQGEGIRSTFLARNANDTRHDANELGNPVGGSAKDGTIQLARLGARRYEVHVRANGYAPHAFTLDLSNGPADDLEIKLTKGTKIVLATEFDPKVTHHISILDLEGHLFFSEHLAGGRTRATWLEPGRYQAVLRHGGTEIARHEFRVTKTDARVGLSE